MSGPAGKGFDKSQASQPQVPAKQGATTQPGAAHEAILALQRSSGNHAVSSLLEGNSGKPLDPATRTAMESKFAEGFSDVRVHADRAAATSAEMLGAKAWTSGRDVVFGEGLYSPGTGEGRKLLAHELAHVVQQRRGGAAPKTFEPESPAERDAASAATQSSGAGPASVSVATGTGIAREEAEQPWWKQRLNPLYQRALEVLPKGAADKLEQANEVAKGFVQTQGVSDKSLNQAVQTAEPVIQPIADYLGVKNGAPTPQPAAASQLPADTAKTAKDEERRRRDTESMAGPQLLGSLQNAGIAPPAAPQPEPPAKLSQIENQEPGLAENLRKSGFNTSAPTPPKPEPQATPAKEEWQPDSETETFLYQLGSDISHGKVSDFQKKYGLSDEDYTRLSKYLSSKGYLPEYSGIGMDYAGRVGTDEDLARREMGARVEALHQDTGLGGIYAAWEGARGGNAEDMQRAGQAGNVSEGLGALATGGLGGSSRAPVDPLKGFEETQHGAPVQPENVAPAQEKSTESQPAPAPIVERTFAPLTPAPPEWQLSDIPGGNKNAANDVLPPKALAPGMSTGEADETKALAQARPTATQAGEKVGGFDAWEGGTKVVNYEENKKDKNGNPIVVRDVTIEKPDDAIQIKTITQLDRYGQKVDTPLPELVARNLNDALEKAYNQPKTQQRARSPIPGTNIYERTNIKAPKKITIIVQVPGTVTQEMGDAAEQALKDNTRTQELPPVEVIVQSRK